MAKHATDRMRTTSPTIIGSGFGGAASDVPLGPGGGASLHRILVGKITFHSAARPQSMHACSCMQMQRLKLVVRPPFYRLTPHATAPQRASELSLSSAPSFAQATWRISGLRLRYTQASCFGYASKWDLQQHTGSPSQQTL